MVIIGNKIRIISVQDLTVFGYCREPWRNDLLLISWPLFKYLILAKICLSMASTKLTINSNGSVKIEGDFEIVDKTGAVYDLGGRAIVSICRCGMSKNKPFCDGSHKGHFEHEAIAFALPPKQPL
jgi:CDGSH-type Zn-finger protein